AGLGRHDHMGGAWRPRTRPLHRHGAAPRNLPSSRRAAGGHGQDRRHPVPPSRRAAAGTPRVQADPIRSQLHDVNRAEAEAGPRRRVRGCRFGLSRSAGRTSLRELASKRRDRIRGDLVDPGSGVIRAYRDAPSADGRDRFVGHAAEQGAGGLDQGTHAVRVRGNRSNPQRRPVHHVAWRHDAGRHHAATCHRVSRSDRGHAASVHAGEACRVRSHVEGSDRGLSG
ncbi:hypothetical protein LTR94_029862, partial [Friedmanniomyces endolithicus]